MADNVSITPGTGNEIAADEVTDGILGQVKVQYVKIMDGTLDSTNKHIITSMGASKVDGSAVTQPVSGPLTDTQLRTTPVPVSGTVTSTPSGTQNVAVTSTVSTPVTGTFFQTTQPISGSVSVSNFPATQPISGTVSISGTSPISGTVTAVQPTGTNLHVVVDSAPTTAVTGTFFQATQPVNGTVGVTQSTIPWQILETPATLCISVTAATGVVVTATLPAVAAQFHYITGIIITKYFTVANAASATPIVITTTNLPGSLAVSMGAPLGTVGTTDVRSEDLATPLKSSVVNTATTIVCPATTGIIWRVNVFYYVAP